MGRRGTGHGKSRENPRWPWGIRVDLGKKRITLAEICAEMACLSLNYLEQAANIACG